MIAHIIELVLAVLFPIYTIGKWVIWWATRGMIDRKDLPEATLAAYRKPLREPDEEERIAEAVRMANEVMSGYQDIVGPKVGAVTLYFLGRHDAATMEELLDERFGLKPAQKRPNPARATKRKSFENRPRIGTTKGSFDAVRYAVRRTTGRYYR